MALRPGMEGHLVLVLVAAALGGGIATAALMHSYGSLWAALTAPLGGSVAALAAAFLLASQRGRDGQADADLDARMEAKVAALREMAAQEQDRRTPSEHPPAGSEATARDRHVA